MSDLVINDQLSVQSWELTERKKKFDEEFQNHLLLSKRLART